MGQQLGEVDLEVVPTFRTFDRQLDAHTSKAMLAAGTRSGARFGDSAGRSAGARFASVFGSAAKAGLIGAIGAAAVLGGAAFKLGQSSLGEAREAQKIGALTVSTIKATGSAANVTAKDVGDLAEVLSLKSGIDDEVIQRGANMVLTFKNIRNEVGKNNDIYDQSVESTLDMAAAMAGGTSGNDLDLKSSSILVGKALNDPVKGLTALTRVGVTFTEGQKKQIETLIESGERMDAQRVILRELQSEFGGAAAAQATLGEKVDVAWGNVQERLGTAILPLVEDVQRAFLRKGVPAIEGWVDTFEDKGIPAIKHWAGVFQDKGIPALRDFYEQAKPIAQEVLPEISEALDTVRDVTKEALPLALELLQAFNDMPDSLKVALVGGGAGLSIAKKLGVGGAVGGLGALATKAAPLPVFVTNPGFGVPGVTPGGGKVPPVVTGLPGGLRSAPKIPAWAPLLPAAGAWGNDTMIPEALPIPKDVLMLDPVRKEMAQLQAMFKTLPSEVKTDIVLRGAPETRRDVMDIQREYDLTPKEVRTLFDTYGIDTSKRALEEYKGHLRSVPEKETTNFSILGVESANASLDRAAARLRELDGNTYRAIFELHSVRTGAGGQDLGYDGAAADGGTVDGSRYPYGDKVSYLLAPGEEVISNRHGQADRYRSLLKAINANRRLADGGTAVGGGVELIHHRQPSLTGLRIEGHIELTESGGYLRGVIAEEIAAERRFDKDHRRIRG